MRFLRRAFSGLFLLALTVALLGWAGQVIWQAAEDAMAPPEPGGPAEERVIAARLIRVEPGEIVPQMTAFGEVKSRRTLELRAPATGVVIDLPEGITDGAVVLAGQVLLRLDPSEAVAARDLAASDLATSEAEGRDAARAIPLARDELAGAVAQAALRSQALDRQRALVSRGAGTEALVQDAELSQNAAAQVVLAARSGLAQAEGRLDQAQALSGRRRITLAQAERALDLTELRAAFGGVLSGMEISAGARVSAGEKLGQIIDPGALEVSFRLSTSQFGRLLDQSGALIAARLAIALDMGGTQIVSGGSLTRVGAEVGQGQTGRLIHASLDAPLGFRPGDFVAVKIAEPALQNVALLPASAIGADGSLLVLSQDDRLQAMPVEVLRRQGDDVILAAGGLAGREVVAQRTPLLGAGIRVKPLRDAASPPPSGEAMAKDVALTAQRRAELIALVEANPALSAEARARLLSVLRQDLVPPDLIEQIEQRRGG